MPPGEGEGLYQEGGNLLLVVTNICTTRCESIRSISCPRTLKRSETIKYVFSNRVAFLWLKVWYLRIAWNFFKRMNNRICHTNFIYPYNFPSAILESINSIFLQKTKNLRSFSRQLYHLFSKIYIDRYLILSLYIQWPYLTIKWLEMVPVRTLP